MHGKTLAVLLCSSLWLSGCTGGGQNGPPIPTISAISPQTLAVGAPDTTIAVTGANFQPGAVVQVGGVSEATTFVSGTELSATIPSAQLSKASSLALVVRNGSVPSAGPAPSLTVQYPVPTIASLSPAVVTVASGTPSLSLTGTGFYPGLTTFQVNGNARTGTASDATHASLSLISGDLAGAGSLQISATNPQPGGGTSGAVPLPVNNPVPSLVSVAPTSVVAGATPPSSLTLVGTNFVASSAVLVNGAKRPTTVVSPNQITVALTAADQAAAGQLLLSVANPAPGGGTSTALPLQVNQPTPNPTIISIRPSQVYVNETGVVLIVMLNTIGFDKGCVIQWNGTDLSTLPDGKYPQLSATLSSSLLSAPGTVNITARCASALAPVSNSLPLTITQLPAPTLTRVSHGTVATNGPAGPMNTAQSMTVTGTGFTADSVIQVNGADEPTTNPGSGLLTAQLPATLLSRPGNYSVTVYTPGGGASTALPYTAYIPIRNNSMILNPISGLLYVSVPSSADPPYAGSVVSINPATGELGTPIPVGTDPDRLALTSDGRFLWVGLDGTSEVRKVDLSTGLAGLRFSLPASTQGAAVQATALAAIPGASDSVAVGLSGDSTPKLAIYDGGVLRTGSVPKNGGQPSYALQIDATTGEIYSLDSLNYEVYGFGLTGLSLKVSTPLQTTPFDGDLQITGGLAVADARSIFQAETGQVAGTLVALGPNLDYIPNLADQQTGKIFALAPAQPQFANFYSVFQIFDLQSFFLTLNTPILVGIDRDTGSITPNISANPVRWGASGIAFRDTDGVYSITSDQVAAPPQ